MEEQIGQRENSRGTHAGAGNELGTPVLIVQCIEDACMAAAVVGLPGWEFATCRIGTCRVLLRAQYFPRPAFSWAVTPKDAFGDGCAMQSEAQEMNGTSCDVVWLCQARVPSRYSSLYPLLFCSFLFFYCWKGVKAWEWCGGTNTTLRSHPAARKARYLTGTSPTCRSRRRP